MACACQKKKNTTTTSGATTYTVTSPDGSQKAYRSKTEARAALLRLPGATVTPPIS